MNSATFAYLSDFIKDRSGLVLSEEKQYLVETRLLPVARKHDITNLDALATALRTPFSGDLATDVIEAMTTNETFFFRDMTPFDNLKETVLPALMKSRTSGRLRIWCAAASSGQEPYSIAIVLKELGAKAAGFTFDIIGTDLSMEVLERAKAATYSQFEVQRGLPVNLLLKYFSQNGDTWQVNQDIRSMVQFRPLNLLRDFSALGVFDIVFCRNVLIYFDRETKTDVLARLAKQMTPDGFLVLGAAETVVGITEAFRPMAGKRGLYQNSLTPAATPREHLKLSVG